MPRTEVYQLRLTKDEKDELARRAKLQGVSIAKLIRQKLSLDSSQRTWGGKPLAVEPPPGESFNGLKTRPSTWKDLLPPS